MKKNIFISTDDDGHLVLSSLSSYLEVVNSLKIVDTRYTTVHEAQQYTFVIFTSVM